MMSLRVEKRNKKTVWFRHVRTRGCGKYGSTVYCTGRGTVELRRSYKIE
jgi:hypothetical protein